MATTKRKTKTNKATATNPRLTWFMDEHRVRDHFARLSAASGKVSEITVTVDERTTDNMEGFSKQGMTAFIQVNGILTDYPSMFDEWCGLCPGSRVLHQLQYAKADSSIEQIVLLIDSPGGYASVGMAVAEAVAEANKSKPCHAVAQGLCASAAYYIASQCESIYATSGCEVGAIGTYCVLADDSKFWEDMGVSFKLITSGGVKGAGADGKITQELIDDTQRIVDDLTARFVADVAKGRGVSTEQSKAWADGRVWLAPEAQTKGLIDTVASCEAAMQAITTEFHKMNLESFRAFAAENPDAVQSFIEQGKKLGAAEVRAFEIGRATELLAACPNREKLAIDSFIAGRSADEIAATVKALDESEAKSAAMLAEKDKQLADANAALETERAKSSLVTAAPLAIGATKADPMEAAKADGRLEASDDGKRFTYKPVYRGSGIVAD